MISENPERLKGASLNNDGAGALRRTAEAAPADSTTGSKPMRNSAIILLCCLGCGTAAAMSAEEARNGLADQCADVEAPCVRQWTQMSASERAHLWPYLDEVSRAMHWLGVEGDAQASPRRAPASASADYGISRSAHGRRRGTGGLCGRRRALARPIQLIASSPKFCTRAVHPQSERPLSCFADACSG